MDKESANEGPDLQESIQATIMENANQKMDQGNYAQFPISAKVLNHKQAGIKEAKSEAMGMHISLSDVIVEKVTMTNFGEVV